MKVISRQATIRLVLVGKGVALLLALAFHIAWLAQPFGWPLRTLHVSLVLFSVARPAIGLLVLAALAPLSASLETVLRSPVPGRSLVLSMLWAVATGVLARRERFDLSPLRTAIPSLLLAATVIGSAAAGIAGDPLFISGFGGIGDAARALVAGELFLWVRPWIPLQYAVLTSLSLLIVVFAEGIVRASPSMGKRIVAVVLAAHAVACAVTIGRLVSAALREPHVTGALVRLILEVRYYSQYDVNAAASTLVIVGCSGIGLMAVTRYLSVTRLLSGLAVVLVLAGIWISGSRAAIAALVVVLVAKLVVETVGARSRRAWMAAAGMLLLIASTAGVLYVYYPQGRNVTLATAYETRLVMLRTAVRAGLSAPVFGIGVGQFQERAPEFGGKDMEPFMGARGTRENAHNQYLQVFAELGTAGALAFALVIACGIEGAFRAPSADHLRSWTAWGLLASLITWMLGHPLLVPEAAVIFWLFLGTVAGLSPAPERQSRSFRVQRVAAGTLLAVTVLAGPFRVWAARREAYLEHFGVGLSAIWVHGDATAYRLAGSRFALFLPSSSTVIVPLRSAVPPRETRTIEVSLRDRIVNRVELAGTDWQELRLVIPSSDRLFERVAFVVRDGATEPSADDIVHVGKIVLLTRHSR